MEMIKFFHNVFGNVTADNGNNSNIEDFCLTPFAANGSRFGNWNHTWPTLL